MKAGTAPLKQHAHEQMTLLILAMIREARGRRIA
jgi:hypothetical protein